MSDLNVVVTKNGIFFKAPDLYERRTLERVNKVCINGGEYLIGELQKNTPVGATGSMKKAWVMEVEYVNVGKSGKAAQVKIYNPLIYVEPTEYGRKASPVSKEGMVSLRLWVQRKLGKNIAESKSIAFAIAKKKKLFPTVGQKFIENTLDYALPKVLEMIQSEFGGDQSDIDLSAD